jgi:dihydroorotase
VKKKEKRLEKKKILINLKHPCLPYPKNAEFKEEIEEIKEYKENKEYTVILNLYLNFYKSNKNKNIYIPIFFINNKGC